MSARRIPGLNTAFAFLVKGAKLLKVAKVFKALKLMKMAGTLLSMGLSVLVYSFLLGPWFSVGFVLLLFVHEMGHVTALRMRGYPASAPLFIPMFGAVIFAPDLGDRNEEAFIGFGGPFAGMVVSALMLVAWHFTNSEIVLRLAYTSAFINLFNLLPIRPLDGGRILQVAGSWTKYIAIAILGLISYAVREPSMLLIWILILDDLRMQPLLKARAAWAMTFMMTAMMVLGFSSQHPIVNCIDVALASLFSLAYTARARAASSEPTKETRPPVSVPARLAWVTAFVVLAAALIVIMALSTPTAARPALACSFGLAVSVTAAVAAVFSCQKSFFDVSYSPMNAGSLPFTIKKTDTKSRARLGVLRTPHGTIKTPAYVIVATHASVKLLKPADLKKTKTQLVIANTYHLWDAPKNAVRKRLGVRMPTMTDSGGFQVFSLGAAKEHGVGKVLKRSQRKSGEVSNVRITEKGVHFSVDGAKRFLSPESSIKTQKRLGADIIFAFDECTSPLHPQEYTRRSMERTHRWAQRCLDVHTKKGQLLFGIVQGGRFKRLRTKSAKIIGAMPFDGFGIGGSFGKDEMRATLAAVIPHLPDEKPRHLLGIGAVADIFAAVEAGVDLFDCVIPTREARHGRIYTDNGPISIKRTEFRGDLRAATIHNVRWFNNLLERIRAALADGSYHTFKREFLSRFSRP